MMMRNGVEEAHARIFVGPAVGKDSGLHTIFDEVQPELKACRTGSDNSDFLSHAPILSLSFFPIYRPSGQA
jgi:hypothetical protein